MANKYKALLLGVGFFGSHWLDILNEDEDIKIVGAAGTEKEFDVLRKKGKIIDLPTFSDYKQAISETDADIAVIVLPAVLHADAAMLAMKKGMHILSEKPLAHNRESAYELIEFRKQYKNLCYVVSQNYRWKQFNYTIKKLIEEKFIGELRIIDCVFRQPEDLTGYRETLPIPLIQDVSIHHFDLFRYFTGKNCKRMIVHSEHMPWSNFVGKETSNAIIEMEDGIIINYSGTWAARGKETTWDGSYIFIGDKGTLMLDENEQVLFYPRGENTPQIIKQRALDYSEQHKCLYLLKENIEKGTMHETSIEDNIESFLMVCMAEESSISGNWVESDKTN